MQLPSWLAALSLVGLVSAASAAPLTYNVSRVVGSGSVSGTITTNGTLGALGLGDITAWSLTVSDGSSTLLMTETTSEFVVSPSALTADLDSIDFNFGAVDTVFAFQSPFIGAGGNFWCGQSGGAASCSGASGAREEIQLLGSILTTRQTGLVSISARIDDRTVPEPASLALASLALLGAAAARRRA